MYTYILVKAPPLVQYGKIAQGRGRETNIARGIAECYIRLETTPEVLFFPYFYSQSGALTGLFYWFILLV